MIQRRQTLWLLLATICAFLSFRFPFVTGKEVITANTVPTDIDVDAASNFFLLILTVASIAISFISIFLFKDRKVQGRVVLAGIFVSLGVIALYIVQYLKVLTPTLALWCILPVIVAASFIMAYRGIRSDDKLVKSLDKLR